MISWRWRGHVDDAAYAIVYSIAIIGFTLIFITFYLNLIYDAYTPLLVFYCLSLSTSCCLLSLSIIFTLITLSYSYHYLVYLFFIPSIYVLL